MIEQGSFKKIDRKIYVTFFVVIAIAVINAVISTFTIGNSQAITSELVNNSNPSLNGLSRFQLLVARSRMLATNWVYFPKQQDDKTELRRMNDVAFIELKGRMNGLMRHWQDTTHSAELKQLMEDYQTLALYETDVMRLLAREQDYRDEKKKAEAIQLLEAEIFPRCDKISYRLQEIFDQRSEMAAAQQDRMLFGFNKLQVLVLGIALLIICSILIAASIINQSIIVPVLKVRKVIRSMGRGELPELNMKFPDNVVGDMIRDLRSMMDGFRRTSRFVEEIGKGNLNHPYQPLSENDVQGMALLNMRNRLEKASESEASRRWIAEGIAELNQIMRVEYEDFSELLEKTLDHIVKTTGVNQAAIFLLQSDNLNDFHIQLGAYHALNKKILGSKRYELKEGLLGQAIATARTIDLDHIYDPYFSIETENGESPSCSVIIIPLLTSGKVVGALEVASYESLTIEKKELLEKMAEPLAASIFSLRANLLTSQLLQESQKQADELAYQELELKKANNELKEKAALLEHQNMTIEEARLGLEFKAEQLEQSNKYKSAFLANVSHELRTPLNSILILAKLLADNRNNNLEQKQIEHAQVIYKSGNDLLTLINDILDLSKIEAGKIELEIDDVTAQELGDNMRMLFNEIAEDREIGFNIVLNEKLSPLQTDKMRLEQVIKNLLSNAFKFTPAGGTVELSINHAGESVPYQTIGLINADEVIAISVKDTGIGIPAEKQVQIFDAFQQADTSTTRKFGGTGLGLSISRELIQMMGGEIKVESVEGKGSCFTLFLPAKAQSNEVGDTTEHVKQNEQQADAGFSGKETPLVSGLTDNVVEHPQPIEVKDDRQRINETDKTILIVEDDYIFASMLMRHCHRFGYKAIIALNGVQGLECAQRYSPYAIILDLRMPVMDGWTVLQKLKDDTDLARIPVHVISAVQKNQLSLDMGAVSYLKKPTSQEEIDAMFRLIEAGSALPKRFLYYGNRPEEMDYILSKLEGREKEVELHSGLTLEECESLARQQAYCGFIIGSEHSETEVRTKLKSGRLNRIPSIHLEAGSGISVASAKVSLGDFKTGWQSTGAVSTDGKQVFEGKTVLIVDDEMRNIYSMTHLLEAEGIQVLCAYNGLQALDLLAKNKQVDVVLMDIMMPEMNGYEAMREIRKNKDWEFLPVIALTAKAMINDREKCMEAGASDFLSKPVRSDEILSVLKVWMYR